MPPTSTSQAAKSEPFQPVAALLAVLFPGLGHFYLGQVRRGVLVTGGVMGLYLTGLLVGGIQCVDRKDNYIWFLGQALVGPMTFGLDYVHDEYLKVREVDSRGVERRRRAPNPTEARNPKTGQPIEIAIISGIPTARTADGLTIAPAYPSYVKAVPRSNELGTLFTTIAGFLNVIVVIDAAFGVRTERKKKVVEGVTKTLKVPVIGGGA